MDDVFIGLRSRWVVLSRILCDRLPVVLQDDVLYTGRTADRGCSYGLGRP